MDETLQHFWQNGNNVYSHLLLILWCKGTSIYAKIQIYGKLLFIFWLFRLFSLFLQHDKKDGIRACYADDGLQWLEPDDQRYKMYDVDECAFRGP